MCDAQETDAQLSRAVVDPAAGHPIPRARSTCSLLLAEEGSPSLEAVRLGERHRAVLWDGENHDQSDICHVNQKGQGAKYQFYLSEVLTSGKRF